MNEVTNKTTAPVRVMIVDDSALMRKLLSETLRRDPGIEVVDTAMDGQFALDHLARSLPDVVLMDVDMPRLDGLSALERIVADYALPVVMCSAQTTKGAEATIQALARGAVDFIEKPTLAALTSGAAAIDISAKVRGAMNARVQPARVVRPTPSVPTKEIKFTVEPVPSRRWLSQIESRAKTVRPELIAIGTSTGGPPALEQVLSGLPADFPIGIVIVQHMPPGFTQQLANHLNRTSQITVREAVEGEPIEPGVALVAPGGKHLRVVRYDHGYIVRVDDQTPPVSSHRPSVDVLFSSVAASTNGRAAGILMTGMGSDGAEGLGKLAQTGAITIAQTPDSCVCHGMPKSAIDRGYASAVVPLDGINSALVACTSTTRTV
jgi:two-component system, chemotaxis family, protein-glutamate methylesterase/glutaminase